MIVYGGTVERWWRKASHAVDPDDVKDVVKKKPEKIVFGAGYSSKMKVPLPETIAWLEEQGIEVIVQPTKEAVQTFNKSNKDTVGCFHLTCS